MGSIWSETAHGAKHDSLCGDINTAAAVIGGGLTGILIAHYLIQSGVETVVLERSHVGGGQTKDTTAKITSQHDLIYDKLVKHFGEEKAGQYAFANQKAIWKYRDIISRQNIDCDYADTDCYLYSVEGIKQLEAEEKAAQSLGIEAQLGNKTDLPFNTAATLIFPAQGKFHPLKFLFALSDGMTVYENTPVLEVENGVIHTPNGTVTAENIVIATHFPFINVPGYYFMRLYQDRSYCIALENAALPNGEFLGVDKDHALSLRVHKNLLILGGASHRTGAKDSAGKYEMLRTAASRYYACSREIAHWTAQDCISLDGVPYIGRYSAKTPNMYVATGFSKWGMTLSMVSAMIISDMINGRKNEFSEVFSPARFNLAASAKTAAEIGAASAAGLASQVFAIPKSEADRLGPGHATTAQIDGQRVGLYKDKNGKLYAVKTKCPHLGCKLEWNENELTWDCPCHGSRFSYTGELIDNPAQTDIKLGQ